MRFLVTVGTGAFEDLVLWADSSEVDCVIQFGSGSRPVNKPSFRFDKEFHDLLDGFDFIITHAGAGTIYKLLAEGRAIIVVPNPNRIDDHQFEIFEYVKGARYALGLSLAELRGATANLEQVCADFLKTKRAYKPPRFKTSEFLSCIGLG